MNTISVPKHIFVEYGKSMDDMARALIDRLPDGTVINYTGDWKTHSMQFSATHKHGQPITDHWLGNCISAVIAEWRLTSNAKKGKSMISTLTNLANTILEWLRQRNQWTMANELSNNGILQTWLNELLVVMDTIATDVANNAGNILRAELRLETRNMIKHQFDAAAVKYYALPFSADGRSEFTRTRAPVISVNYAKKSVFLAFIPKPDITAYELYQCNVAIHHVPVDERAVFIVDEGIARHFEEINAALYPDVQQGLTVKMLEDKIDAENAAWGNKPQGILASHQFQWPTNTDTR